MFRKMILFTMVIVTLLTLLTACGSAATTSVATEKPTTSAPPTTTPPTSTPATTTPPTTTPPPTTPVTTTPVETTTPVTTTPVETTTPVTTTPVETTTPPTPTSTTNNGFNVASKMADFLFHIQLVQNYYADGLTALATFQVEETATKEGARDGSHRGIANVPPEFRKKLPSGGAMPAEPGSCAAAARPTVTFMTEGDKPVTPEMMIEKNLQSVPEEYVTVAQDEANSLMSKIEDIVQPGDYSRLITPDAWNELLWDKIKDLQTPAESLMDYQLWNAAPDIETDIVNQYRERLVADGLPNIVLDAYDASDTHGWFANQEAEPEDALARMEIEAEMTGSAQGTVYEHRDFHLEGAGDTPIYRDQTGEGIVTYNISDYGDVEFQVAINLDKFDERGHAIGGTASGDAINPDFKGYQVVFTFDPLDGSKKGVVTKDGQEVGNLNMTVDQDKFENYIDNASGMEIPLPDDIQIPETTTPPA